MNLVSLAKVLILIHKFLTNLFLLILKDRLHVGDPLEISVYFEYPLYLSGMHSVSKRLMYNDESKSVEPIIGIFQSIANYGTGIVEWD